MQFQNSLGPIMAMQSRTKGGFYSERAGKFIISPNRRTKLFSGAKILIFLFILNGSNHVK